MIAAPLDAPRRGESERVAGEGNAPAFEVIDVLGGFCRLERRDGTLGGSVPLRVAQACAPLLEGNAYGFQVALSKRLDVFRRRRGYAVSFDGEGDLARLHRANLPMLHARGLLSPGAHWSELFAASIVGAPAPAPLAVRFGQAVRREAPRLFLFTGLFVRPAPGLRLRQSMIKNRRSFAYQAREALILDTERFTPLVLELEANTDTFTLAGEIATLAPLLATTRLAVGAIEDAPSVAAAHLAFYDANYFATKRGGEVSRKYRRERASAAVAPREAYPAEAALSVALGGPRSVREEKAEVVHGPDGPSPYQGEADRLVVDNAVSLRARFDGLDLSVEPDKDELARFAAEVRSRWQPLMAARAASGDTPHEGALLYLTKYVTPHPRGEAHFFVKPAALVHTPKGTATLIEGIPGAGYDVMRGVIETDRFHATPAVFQLPHVDRAIDVPSGQPLAHLFAVPSWLLTSTFSFERGGFDGALS